MPSSNRGREGKAANQGRYELFTGEGLFLDLGPLSLVQLRVEAGSVTCRGTLLRQGRTYDVFGGPLFISCIEQTGKSPAVLFVMMRGDSQARGQAFTAEEGTSGGAATGVSGYEIPPPLALVFRNAELQNEIFEAAGFLGRACQLGCRALVMVTGHASLAPYEVARSLASIGIQLGENVLVASLDPLIQPFGYYGCLNAAVLQSEDFTSFFDDVGVCLSVPFPLNVFGETSARISPQALRQTAYFFHGGSWEEEEAAFAPDFPGAERHALLNPSDQLTTPAIKLIVAHWNLYCEAVRALLARVTRKADLLTQYSDFMDPLQLVLLLPPHNNTAVERTVISNVLRECLRALPACLLGGMASSPREAMARHSGDLDALFGLAHRYGCTAIRAREEALGCRGGDEVQLPSQLTDDPALQSRLEIEWYSTPHYLPLILHTGTSFLTPPVYSVESPWGEEIPCTGTAGAGGGSLSPDENVARPMARSKGSAQIGQTGQHNSAERGGELSPPVSRQFFVPIVELRGMPQTLPLNTQPLFRRSLAEYFHGPSSIFSPIVSAFRLSSRPTSETGGTRLQGRAGTVVVLELTHADGSAFENFLMGDAAWGAPLAQGLSKTGDSHPQGSSALAGPANSFKVLSELVEQPYEGLLNTVLLVLDWDSMDREDISPNLSVEEFKALVEGERGVPFVLRSSAIGLGVVRGASYEGGVHTLKILLPRILPGAQCLICLSTGLLSE